MQLNTCTETLPFPTLPMASCPARHLYPQNKFPHAPLDTEAPLWDGSCYIRGVKAGTRRGRSFGKMRPQGTSLLPLCWVWHPTATYGPGCGGSPSTAGPGKEQEVIKRKRKIRHTPSCSLSCPEPNLYQQEISFYFPLWRAPEKVGKHRASKLFHGKSAE